MKWHERAGVGVLAKMAPNGTLSLALPSGEQTTIGTGSPRADLEIRSYSAVGQILREGLIGFAEAYMSGVVETTDLSDLLAWGVANQEAWFEHPLARWTVPLRKLFQRIIPERRHRRVRSMNDHYNLGNDFYEAWLDETMTYSSARFRTPDQGLDEAQRHKYETVAAAAGLRPGMRVLEIGCGFGGFARFAAGELGCEVVGITLSREQAAYAERAVRDSGLEESVEVRVQDFRDVNAQFDAVVSIEMIESVDESQWPDLFSAMSRYIRPGGRVAMQIITIADSEWERYRSRADFIQQYIFPGGQLPAPKILRGLAKTA
ncbi:MAG: cyclopropane-fatty-acyl-phospholipid synthase family protein, partial [Acidimicrobiia bacterium]|nr:cyclopropane-fatty-acyl-phospholipid synthase family protein [Acidimicrobiia bacterium]